MQLIRLLHFLNIRRDILSQSVKPWHMFQSTLSINFTMRTLWQFINITYYSLSFYMHARHQSDPPDIVDS